jgi:hypothetical protein
MIATSLIHTSVVKGLGAGEPIVNWDSVEALTVPVRVNSCEIPFSHILMVLAVT